MPDLPSLIRQLRDQGYSDQYIRQYLQQYGYSEQQIDEALQPKQVHHEHHVTASTILFLVLFLSVVGGATYVTVTYLQGSSGEALLDVTLEPGYTQLEPGDNVNYRMKITNMGSKDRFDVRVQHQFIKDGTVQRTVEETLAVSTTTTKIKEMAAPPPGEYTMRTTAEYEDKTAESSFSFTVAGQQTQNISQENTTGREDNDTGEQNTTEQDKKDASAVTQEARQLASTQPSAAEERCLELQGEPRDDCLSIIVKESQRPEFCENIQSDETRDNCYMTFIVEGQAQLCNEVVLNSSKNYCDRLEDVQIMAKYR